MRAPTNLWLAVFALSLTRAFAADSQPATGLVTDSGAYPVKGSSGDCWRTRHNKSTARQCPFDSHVAEAKPAVVPGKAAKQPATAKRAAGKQRMTGIATAAPVAKGNPGYVADSNSRVVRGSQGECWHTSQWTSALANVIGCDGVLGTAMPVPAPAPSPKPQPPQRPLPTAEPLASPMPAAPDAATTRPPGAAQAPAATEVPLPEPAEAIQPSAANPPAAEPSPSLAPAPRTPVPATPVPVAPAQVTPSAPPTAAVEPVLPAPAPVSPEPVAPASPPSPAATTAPKAPASPSSPESAPSGVTQAPAKPALGASAQPKAEKVTLDTNTYFDFDKVTLKPEGRRRLDALAKQIGTLELEVVVATGHTDWTGSAAYNQQLSEQRAIAVKRYLAQKGIPSDRIFTAGKGEKEPAASNKTREGRAKNRRVDVETVGTRK